MATHTHRILLPSNISTGPQITLIITLSLLANCKGQA